MDDDFPRLMSTYSRVMNERLYDVCAGMSDADRKRDRHAFFGSIHGTLNHMLLTDRLWFGSFVDKPVSFSSLNEELYEDFDELRSERAKTDAEICGWARKLTGRDLNGPFRTGNAVMKYPMWVLLAHFFNHQTHHRGQITVMLSQQGLDYGVTDLPWVPGVVDVLEE